MTSNPRLGQFIVKCTMLARLAKMRLEQPMINSEGETKTLQIAFKAAGMLTRIVPILKFAQFISNVPSVATKGRVIGHEIGRVRLHNKSDPLWRVLQPGNERATKHLRWRK
ncbi:hypothetical protein BdWA1_003233 [Babesia duncani]|uniref:Uncharacterized protein n=1 Tax=Babesia duncani TaxID=323732 RepID=A0AAD9PJD5_9APIC|nr:hypothetical protein BdWA1_003233 [Babesia duncani]